MGHIWRSCKPRAHRGVFHTFGFSFAQNFTHVVEDSAAAYFGMVIALRIRGRGESMCDFVLVTETHHLPVGEVRSIFGDNGVGEPEAAYYVLLKELDNLLPDDFREALS